MIRIAPVLGLLLLVAACSPATPPVAVAGGSPRSALADPTCADTSTFISHVYQLSGNYSPAPGGKSFPGAVQYAGTGAIKSDLNAAFANAPAWFQNHLCSLTAIYLNPPSGREIVADSWGFRRKGASSGSERTYIAISGGLWPSGEGASAVPLSSYENEILTDLVDWTPAPAITSADPDTSWMAVMAALAHEMGHVQWARTTIPTAGGNYKFGKLQSCPSGDFFADWAYTDNRQLRPPQRWRFYTERGNDAGPTPVDHAIPPSINLASNSELNQLLQNDQAGPPPVQQGWASLFGAQTPDEDFVETYVMAVLTGFDPISNNFSGPLKSLPVTISGVATPPDVPAGLWAGQKAEVLRKMGCIPI